MTEFEQMYNDGKEHSQEEVREVIKRTVASCQTIKELNEFLQKLHPVDCYKVIRDVVDPKKNKMIRNDKQEHCEDYQVFQDIQLQAKQMWNYTNRQATIGDVQDLITSNISRYYNILVRMISKVDDELGLVEKAVNTIEERLEIPLTNFDVLKEEISDDATRNDEQGEQDSIAGNGEDGK
jgi:hypothetical protein